MKYEAPYLTLVNTASKLILGGEIGADDNVAGGPQLEPGLAVALDE